jgi:hypothetical protein
MVFRNVISNVPRIRNQLKRIRKAAKHVDAAFGSRNRRLLREIADILL